MRAALDAAGPPIKISLAMIILALIVSIAMGTGSRARSAR